MVTDAEYHYEAVNVAAQQSNPQSLLWWMKRIIALRKRHPAFGRGSLRFLHPGNRRILAYLREDGDETLLVVANLSRYAQWTELDLAAYAGQVPVELFGAVEFPRIGSEPYLRQPGPALLPVVPPLPRPVSSEGPAWHEDGLPELRWRGDLEQLLRRPGDQVAGVLLRWMRTRSWYRGSGQAVQAARVVEVIVLPGANQPVVLAAVEVRYRHAETGDLPVAARPPPRAGRGDGRGTEDARQAVVARLTGAGEPPLLLDGSQVPGVFETLLQLVVGRRQRADCPGCARAAVASSGLTGPARAAALRSLRARPHRRAALHLQQPGARSATAWS